MRKWFIPLILCAVPGCGWSPENCNKYTISSSIDKENSIIKNAYITIENNKDTMIYIGFKSHEDCVAFKKLFNQVIDDIDKEYQTSERSESK